MVCRLRWLMVLLTICAGSGLPVPCQATVSAAAPVRELTAGEEFLPAAAAADVQSTPAAAGMTSTQVEKGFLNNPAAPVPERQSLPDLVGRAEIAVLENIDWQFVSSMDENRVIGEDFAGKPETLDLSNSIRAGRGFSRESQAAAARTEQAQARTGQALGLLLPSLTVRANYGSETSAPSVELDEEGDAIPKDTHDRTDVAWTLRQPLFDLPSYFDWRRRQVIELASHENYRISDGDAYLATTSAYLTLVSTRLQAELTRDFEAQLAELLSYIEKRVKGGAASVSDMARVRARSQETLSFRLEQEAAHEAAGIDFVRLTNLVPSRVRLPEYGDVGADGLAKSFSAAVATAMQHNPEIAALAAEIRAAEIDRKAAKSQFLPRLDAEYTDTYSQHAGGDTESDGQRDKRGMLVFSWTPLNGGRDYEYYRERTARYKELQYRFDDERRGVVQALSANYSTLAITGERIKSGYSELKSIALAVEAMSRRMLSGNQSLLDLLDVYDRFYQARSRLVELHILEMFTMARLVRLTTGTPWAAPDQIIAAAGVESPIAVATAASRQKPAAKADLPAPSVPQPSAAAESSPLEAAVAAEAPAPALQQTPRATVPVPAEQEQPPPAVPVASVPATAELEPSPLGFDAETFDQAAEFTRPAGSAAVAVTAPPPAAPPVPDPVAVGQPAAAVAPLPGEGSRGAGQVARDRQASPAIVEARPTPVSPPPPPAAAPVDGTAVSARSVDDAYAPLWLDIIPDSGTALALKNYGESKGSTDRGLVAAAMLPVPARPSSQVADSTVPSGALTLGLLDSGDQVRIDRVVHKVEELLGEPVNVRLFADEPALVNWFRRLGVVDLAVITVGERGDLLAGDYALLQALSLNGAPRSEILVARRDLPAAQLERLVRRFANPQP